MPNRVLGVTYALLGISSPKNRLEIISRPAAGLNQVVVILAFYAIHPIGFDHRPGHQDFPMLIARLAGAGFPTEFDESIKEFLLRRSH